MVWFVVLACMFLADYIWINYIVKSIYQSNVEIVQKQKFKLDALSTGVVYAFIAFIFAFVTVPLVQYYHNRGTNQNLLVVATMVGGLVGFCVYGLFNFTSKAIFVNYSWTVAIIDTLWGTSLFAFACCLYYFLVQKIKR